MQLLGTGKQRAGKTSQIFVGGSGGTALCFASWDNTLNGDDLDTVNFQSYNVAAAQTFDEGIMGVLGCDTKFGGDWDAGTNPFADPPGLFPRDDLTNVLMYTSRLDAVNWSFPYIRLRTSTNSSEVRGKVAFNCGGKNQGPFTYPTTSV